MAGRSWEDVRDALAETEDPARVRSALAALALAGDVPAATVADWYGVSPETVEEWVTDLDVDGVFDPANDRPETEREDGPVADREHGPETDRDVDGQVRTLEGEIERLRDEVERLRTENERLKDFASIVAHDLRNPLSVARGHLDLAEASGDPDHFAEVRTAHDRIGTIIEHTLTLATEGVETVDPARVDLRAVARSAWGNVATGDADLDVAGSATLQADEDGLQQLLENVFRNAIEHAGPDVDVRVGTLADDRGFYVADDGPGIPPDDRDRVFDREYTTGGTGLGLAIVGEIAEAHGWTVDVDESEAGGARIRVVTGGEA